MRHHGRRGERCGRRRGAGALVGALVGSLVLGGCSPDSEAESARTSEAPASEAGRAASSAPAGPTATLAFAGDVHLEGALRGLSERPRSTLGPMSRVLRGADLAMVNLESALTRPGTGAPAAKELEDPSLRYWFRSPPSALDLLDRSGVDVVSVANNHGADYGAAGLRDTLAIAADSPVGVVGVGADPTAAFTPHRVEVEGLSVGVLAADSSPLESADPTWSVREGAGPGLAAARTPDAPRLLAAVRDSAATDDVTVVYLHWGEEGAACPTPLQQDLAASLAEAGADVVVGSHSHQLQGGGLLDDAYVGYGLGNFLWYHGRQAETGVLEVEVSADAVEGVTWQPARIPEPGGQPQPVTGAARGETVADWRRLRGCTGLEPGPGAAAEPGGQPDPPQQPDPTQQPDPPATEALPAYRSEVRRIGPAVRRSMLGSSHRPTCPVPLTDLRQLRMSYVGFDGAARTGAMVVHEDVAEEVTQIFRTLYRERFPIRRMRLVDAYGGDDDRSMAANNTSGYNCRTVAGTDRFSDHAFGRALDINPVQNPYVLGGEVLPPAGRAFADVDRSPGARVVPGVIARGDVVFRAFASRGWEWGGDYSEPDWQHWSAP